MHHAHQRVACVQRAWRVCMCVHVCARCAGVWCRVCRAARCGNGYAARKRWVYLRLLEVLVEGLVEGGGVDHLGAEEGVEEVVAAIVVVGDLVRRRRDRLEGRRRPREELLEDELDQAPVGAPVNVLLAVVDERLVAVLLEGDVVVEELLHQDVDRDLALAPLFLERIVLHTNEHFLVSANSSGAARRARAWRIGAARCALRVWQPCRPSHCAANRTLKIRCASVSAGGVARKTNS